jgi:hypothetical protein
MDCHRYRSRTRPNAALSDPSCGFLSELLLLRHKVSSNCDRVGATSQQSISQLALKICFLSAPCDLFDLLAPCYNRTPAYSTSLHSIPSQLNYGSESRSDLWKSAWRQTKTQVPRFRSAAVAKSIFKRWLYGRT